MGPWWLFDHAKVAMQKLCLRRNLGFEERSRVEVIADGIEAESFNTEIAGLGFYPSLSNILPVRIEMDCGLDHLHPSGLRAHEDFSLVPQTF